MDIKDLKVGDRAVARHGSYIEHVRIEDIGEDAIVVSLSDGKVIEIAVNQIIKRFER